MRVRRKLVRSALLFLCCAVYAGLGARSAQAAPYYVTVAGLGGEPDYEQRFTALARELDKLFKAGASDAHVNTFSGGEGGKGQFTTILGRFGRTDHHEGS